MGKKIYYKKTTILKRFFMRNTIYYSKTAILKRFFAKDWVKLFLLLIVMPSVLMILLTP